MQYRPSTLIEDLHLKLGYAGTGDMTAGSAALAVGFSPLPWQLSGTPLSAADIGTEVSVIGAGPNAPFVPLFGPRGKMLVTTLAGVTDGGHGTLAAAASNDTQSGASNTVLYREVPWIQGTLNYSGDITTPGRGTLRFTLISKTGSMLAVEGMPVLLKHDVLGYIFGGQIDSCKLSNVTAKPGDPLEFECTCISTAVILTRRLVSPFVLTGGAFTDMAGADIVDHLIWDYADSEGLSTTRTDDGPIITIGAQALNSLATALDNVCAACFSLSGTYIWTIDPWRVVSFGLATAAAAPWNINEDDASDGNALVAITITGTREKLCTVVYDTESAVLDPSTTETFPGKNEQTYNTLKPIGAISSLKVNGTTEPFGFDGNPTARWFWSQGSNTLTHGPVTETFHGPGTSFLTQSAIAVIDSSHTVIITVNGGAQTVGNHGDSGKNWYLGGTGHINQFVEDAGGPVYGSGDVITITYSPYLTPFDTLVVTYQPQFTKIFYADNLTKRDARAALESGTGIWGTSQSGDVPIVEADGQARAQSIPDELGDPPKAAEYSTFKPGLNAGQFQHIKLGTMHMEGDFLIDSISMSEDGQYLKWDIHAVNGALIGDWRSAFGQAPTGGFGGGTNSQVNPTFVTDPPDGLTFTPALYEYGTVTLENVAVAVVNSLIGIDWYLMVVDELTADPTTGCWAETTSDPGTTDPVTLTVTPNAANSTGLNFVEGDFVLFNDSGHYEIVQLTTKAGNDWTLTRQYPGSPAGNATFASLVHSHAAGTKLFKVVARKFPQAATAGGSISATVTPRFDLSIPNALVCAVVAAPYNVDGYGPFVVYNTALSTLPGLRTCNGGTYTFTYPGVLVAAPGDNSGITELVQYASSIRTMTGIVSVAPTGAAVIVIPRYSRDGGATWNGLSTGESIAVTKKTTYDGLSPQPGEARSPYGQDWPYQVLKPGDWLNFSIQQIGSTVAGSDLTVQVMT